MNVSNSYPTDKYPQLTSPSLAKNREEALAQAIAMIEGVCQIRVRQTGKND